MQKPELEKNTTENKYKIRVINPYSMSLIGVVVIYFLINKLIISAQIKKYYHHNYKVFNACSCPFVESIIENDMNKVYTGDTACFDQCIKNPACVSATQRYHELGEGKSACILYSARCPKLQCTELHGLDTSTTLLRTYYLERQDVDVIEYI